VPAETIAQALPYVNWVVLTSLAIGAFAFAAAAGALSPVTGGFLRFIAFAAALLAGLALLSDLSLPAADGLAIRPAGEASDTVRQAGLGAFVVLSALYGAARGRGRRAAALGVAAIAAAIATFAAAATWTPDLADAPPLFIQLLSLAAVTGGSLAAVVLGHWYLVTPRLPAQPLVLLSRLLLLALGLQICLFIVWTTLGGGPGQRAWDAFTGSAALFVWLRLIVSLGFAAVLVAMASRTAQLRSMESATGLLYINLAAVLAGTIGAAALYVSSGLLL
jgi:hypothetical protein